ncbi:MAG: TnsD family Tn7-like transposition protein [Verrucomicrobiota bacterium]|jgi:hypothetical protein
MIPNAIRPLPDELMYSMVARAYWLTPHGSLRRVAENYYNGPTGLLVKDLTPRLGDLHQITGVATDPLDFIKNSTLLRLYIPFLLPRNLARIEKQLLSGTTENVHILAGIQNCPVQSAEWLRYCPCCAAEERAKWGEAYWHRLFQVAGVMVCPGHKVFLKSSEVPMRAGADRSSHPVAAEEAIPEEPPVSLDLSNPDHQTLLRIALSAEELLRHDFRADGFDKLRERYHALASERGYLTLGHRIRFSRLLADFQARYSPALLVMLASEVNKDLTNTWVARMFHQSDHGHPPLRHLLLMDFFETTPLRFAETKAPVGMLGIGPWPCKNPVCPATGQNTICAAKYVYDAKKKRQVGILTCPVCGQIARRSIINGLLCDVVSTRGPIWEQALATLWGNTSLSLCEISKRLAATRDALIGHALRRGLPLPREGKGGPSGTNLKRFIKKPMPSLQELTEKHHAIWLDMQKLFPKELISDLRQRAGASYLFLLKNDAAWFRKNSPKSGATLGRTGKKVDWADRDRQWALLIEAAFNKILNAGASFKQITRGSLIRHVGTPTTIKKNLERLPLTKQACAFGKSA